MAEYWLPMAFHDSALLHVFIRFADLFATNNNNNKNIYYGRTTGARHLNAAVSLINR
jgi:hypothetical protein